MGLTHPLLRRALAIAIAPTVIAGSMLLSTASATAAPANPTPVSADALPTVQVDGVVWTQVVIGHTVYAGGSFTTAQPAGAAAGVGTTSRSNLLAYDVDTGELVDGFAPSFNAQVRGLAASPDGRRLYAVGDFTAVNGTPRNRIVALDPATGSVVPDFAPSLNSLAVGVAATSTRVFVGGAFTAASGVTRSRVASFSTSGQTLPWAPQASGGTVRAVVVSPDASKVVIGGGFTSTNGQTSPGRGMAAVDATSGASLPWATGTIIHNGGVVDDPRAPANASSSIYSLSTRGDVVYATGQATGTDWSDANLEGMVAMRWSDGGLKWLEDCHGDTYSSVAFDDAVYVASHSHNCATVGGFGEIYPDAHRAVGFSQAATRTLLHNQAQGPGSYQDFGGLPAPTVLDWLPTFTIGTYTGTGQAAWSVAQGGGYLLYGGEFTKVNGKRQTGLVRFKGYPDPADGVVENPAPVSTPTPSDTPTATPSPTAGPTAPAGVHTPGPTDPAGDPTTGPTPPPAASKPGRVATPDAVALGPTKAAVKWSAPKAAKSDGVSGYVVKAYKGSKLVKSVSVAGSIRLATISGLKRSTSYRIGVAAKNAHGTGKLSVLDSVRTKAKGANASAVKKPSKVAKPTVGKGSAKLRARWSGASAKGALGVSKYQVRVVLRGKTVKLVSVSAAARSKLVSGLKHGVAYSVSVRAGNWAGWGAWSTSRSARTR